MFRDVRKLGRVEAIRVGIPFSRPFETVGGLISVRNSWILRLTDVDGHDGFGEVALDPAASPGDENRLARVVREAIASMEDGRIPAIETAAARGVTGRALMAGLDAALDTLRRVSSGTPDAAGQRASVLVNATLDMAEAGPAAEAAVRAVAEGLTCLKLKVGREEPGVLVDRVRAVRAAVGDSVRLRLDANCSWSYSMAVELLDALAAFDIEYVEQPLAPTDLYGHAALRRHCAVQIALDESVESEGAAAAILAANAADVLVVKPARVGGPGAVRAIATLAASAGVPLVLSTFFETGIGTDAALRAAAALPEVGAERAHGLATAGMLVHDLLETPAPVVGGRISLTEGLAVDEDALRRFTIEKVAHDP